MSATHRGFTREDQDSYSTPQYAIDLILDRIYLDRVLISLEPCRGENRRIYNLLPGTVLWCEIKENLDYLDFPFDRIKDIDLILTNPPFSLALEFLKKSLSEAKTVIYLLRLNFLGGIKRKQFWDEHPPSHLYVLAKRPSFFDTGGTDATEYAWFCWDRGGLMKDIPGIYVIGDSTERPDIDLELFS